MSFIRAAAVLTWCVEPRTVGLFPQQLATILTDANDNLTRQAVYPGIALGPVYIRPVVAATASGTGLLCVLLPAQIIVSWLL